MKNSHFALGALLGLFLLAVVALHGQTVPPVPTPTVTPTPIVVDFGKPKVIPATIQPAYVGDVVVYTAPTPYPSPIYPNLATFPREVIVTVVGAAGNQDVEILGYPSSANSGNPVYVAIHGLVTSGANQPLTYAVPANIQTLTVYAYDSTGKKWVASWAPYVAATPTPTPTPVPTPLRVPTPTP